MRLAEGDQANQAGGALGISDGSGSDLVVSRDRKKRTARPRLSEAVDSPKYKQITWNNGVLIILFEELVIAVE